MRNAVLILLLMCSFSLRAATNDAWETDFTNAVKVAKENGRPIVVQFHASWCGPCRMMKQTTLKDATVVKNLEQFTRLSLDFDVNQELAKRYGIQGIPAFLVLDPEGNEVAKSIGYRDASQFNDWLQDGLAGVAFAEGQKNVFREKCAEIEAKLKTADQKQDAIALLLDFCSREKSYKEFAAEKLKAIAAKEPVQILDGLNHPRLATRIHIANLLRVSTTNKFEFDPWETAENRQKAVEHLKVSLATP